MLKKEIAKERIKVLELKEETLKTLKALVRIKSDSEIKERIEYKNEIARKRIEIAIEIKRLGDLI